MRHPHRLATRLVAIIVFPILSASTGAAQSSASATIGQEAVVTLHAHGTFDVKMAPMATDSAVGAGAAGVGRMSIDKTFHGDIEGTSKGEMLAFMTDVSGSAGYVAMERVTGTLAGKRGSFVLQHSGTMTRGAPHLVLTVVPDSGTEELKGLSGSMEIIISGKEHSYDFSYQIVGS